jgi:Methyltransferase domain
MLKHDLPWIGRVYRQRDELRQKLRSFEMTPKDYYKRQLESLERVQEDGLNKGQLESLERKLESLVKMQGEYLKIQMEYLEKLRKVEPIQSGSVRENSEQGTARLESADAFPVFVTNRTQQKYTLLSELRRQVAVECADYANEYMASALHFETRERLLDYAISKVDADRNDADLLLEFGVYKGHSINHLAKRIKPGRTIYGFDSFEGLHVDWRGNDLAKGAFSLEGVLPDVEKNVTLIKGWFDKTLPIFFAKHAEPIAFVSHDCDTYEATKIVFKFTAERLRPGTMILFDDYWGYRGWKLGEHKAWAELVKEMNIKYDYLAFTIQQVFVVIRSIG